MNDAKTTVLEEPYDDEEEYDEDGAGPGRGIAIAVVVALVLGVGGYFAGHASAGGPATLAEAVQQAQDGKLACGDTGAAARAPAAGTPDAQGGANQSAFLVRAVCGNGQNGGTGGPQGRGAGQGRFGGGLLGGPGATTGQVESVSGSTLTVQGRQGTVKLKLSPSTVVTTTSKGALSDLKAGQTVAVTGQGTARSVFILPAGQ
jgi:hypothetical protein